MDQPLLRLWKAPVKRDRAAVVCDLLFGLPGQDAQTRGEDLAIARDIGLDGVDLYALNVLPNTPLGKAVENGRTTVPSPAGTSRSLPARV